MNKLCPIQGDHFEKQILLTNKTSTMKRTLTLLLFIAIFSCNKSIDRTNYKIVGESLFRAVVNNDTLAVKNLFIPENNDQKNEKEVGFHLKSELELTRKETFDSFKQFNNKEAIYLKTDTIAYSSFNGEYAGTQLNVFFKTDTSFYKIVCMVDKGKGGIISLKDYLHITKATKDLKH